MASANALAASRIGEKALGFSASGGAACALRKTRKQKAASRHVYQRRSASWHRRLSALPRCAHYGAAQPAPLMASVAAASASGCWLPCGIGATTCFAAASPCGASSPRCSLVTRGAATLPGGDNHQRGGRRRKMASAAAEWAKAATWRMKHRGRRREASGIEEDGVSA